MSIDVHETSSSGSTSRGHGDKLDSKKHAAISALLTNATIEKAALAVGVSEKTLWRWLQLPEFSAAYQQARTEVLEQTISVLHKATGAAVAALVRNLKCGAPSVEVRAALGVLDQTFKAREMLEMEARLKAVEEMLEHSRPEQASGRSQQGRRGYG